MELPTNWTSPWTTIRGRKRTGGRNDETRNNDVSEDSTGPRNDRPERRTSSHCPSFCMIQCLKHEDRPPWSVDAMHRCRLISSRTQIRKRSSRSDSLHLFHIKSRAPVMIPSHMRMFFRIWLYRNILIRICIFNVFVILFSKLSSVRRNSHILSWLSFLPYIRHAIIQSIQFLFTKFLFACVLTNNDNHVPNSFSK